MPYVTVKTKYQVTLPRKLREELGIDEGDLLAAEIQDGKIVLVPKVVMDRTAAFSDLRAIANESQARWRSEGMSDEDIERLIAEEVSEVRSG